MAASPSQEMVQQLVTKVVDWGVDGVGFMTGAAEVADEHLRDGDSREQAIKRLVATHRRIVGASGFAAGIGGVWTMPVAVPADLTVLYMPTRHAAPLEWLTCVAMTWAARRFAAWCSSRCSVRPGLLCSVRRG